MPNTERILTFIDVVEIKNISEVAKKRNVTPAAISKQISQFESECGCQLLHRSPRGIKLTETGRGVYEKVRSLRTNLREIESYLGEFRDTPQGILRVFSIINFAKAFIFPYLNQWLENHPLISLELDLGERTPDLEKENYDIFMGSIAADPPSAIKMKIGAVRYYLCASPKYLKAFGYPTTLANLRSHRYLTHTERPQNYLIKADDEEIILTPYFYLNSFQGLVQLALEGLGFIWISEAAVKQYLESGELVEILPEKFKNNYRSLYLYYKETKHVAPKVRAFIEFVKDCFAKFEKNQTKET